jgi:hypothetical protein
MVLRRAAPLLKLPLLIVSDYKLKNNIAQSQVVIVPLNTMTVTLSMRQSSGPVAPATSLTVMWAANALAAQCTTRMLKHALRLIMIRMPTSSMPCSPFGIVDTNIAAC